MRGPYCVSHVAKTFRASSTEDVLAGRVTGSGYQKHWLTFQMTNKSESDHCEMIQTKPDFMVPDVLINCMLGIMSASRAHRRPSVQVDLECPSK
jgi:hypothetical protein